MSSQLVRFARGAEDTTGLRDGEFRCGWPGCGLTAVRAATRWIEEHSSVQRLLASKKTSDFKIQTGVSAFLVKSVEVIEKAGK